jgi:hypothetical protein
MARGALLPRDIEVRHGAHLARIDAVHQDAACFERGRQFRGGEAGAGDVEDDNVG